MAQVWREWGSVVVGWVLGLPLAALSAVALTRWRRRSQIPTRQAWARSLTEVGMIAGTLPWIWMILTPRSAPRMVYLVPLEDLARQLAGPPATAVAQIGGNLLVFAALGFCAPIRFVALAGVARLFALGAAGSVLVETLQFCFDLGRVSSVDDVLVNATGAALAGLLSCPWWTGAARIAVPATTRP